ncbi:MAG: hypothetical protein KGV59_01440 [Tenacibaculum sp.]|nr:hypothetical protein [Tenacibaculum sp.]
MKLIPKNSNYVNPITGEIVKNVFVSSGEFSDIPLLQKLKVSFWLCQTYEDVHFIKEENDIKEVSQEKIKVLDSDTLEFTKDSDTPTYVTIDGTTQDLFAYLQKGGKLKGTEKIEVGYPNYNSIQRYFHKDNIGDALEFNPELDVVNLRLAQDFVLKNWKLNGEPLGVQFKFE